MTNWITACAVDDLVESKPRKVDIDGLEIALVKTAQGLFAVEDTCTHAEVSLSEGDVVDCTIECWMHGASFSLQTGEALTPPAVKSLKTFPTQIISDGAQAVVQIQVSE